MPDDFKHKATHQLFDIYALASQLHKEAQADINAPLAIETRDLCHDILYRIDMFDKLHLQK